MEGETLKVLLIEDSPGDARLLSENLRDAREERIDVVWSATLEEGLARLAKEPFDAVLLDLLLPDSFGVDTLERVLARDPGAAIVVLTALEDRDIGIRAMRAGAEDFIAKGRTNPDQLARSIRHAVERKRALEALHRRVQDLRRANQQLEKFVFVVSHDLKEPLSDMQAQLLLLSREPKGRAGDERGVQALDRALSSSRRMKALLDSLTDYAQVESAGGTLVETDPAPALDKALEALKPEIVASRATVTREALPRVLADPEQLVLLFQQLLRNAIRFKSSATPEVHVGGRTDDGDVILSVKDNGVGIDPKHFHEIFEIFSTLDPDRSGPGVGLAICRKIVERHGGRIWADSLPGRGATFFFTLRSPEAQRENAGPETRRKGSRRP